MSEAEQPKTLGKKLENLWYHYKPFVIIGIIAFIVIVICTVQSVTRKKQDVIVYHAAMQGLTLASQDDFRESAKLVAEDYNGDGNIVVDFKEDVYVPNEAVALGQPTTTDRFNLELAMGECVVYIMDGSFYRGNRDFMSDLADIFDVVPSYAYDEKAFRLGDIPAYDALPGIHDLPEDSYICLRLKRDGMKDSDYENSKRFFISFVTYGA